ncbi:MAG: AMP-binding protein [Rhodobacteraceae bacterium]|jgi:fatty-acyl-CoA synthase|nr:AMP-binding protein [Paracoccaceae bacterium]
MTIESTMQHGQLGVAAILRMALRHGTGSDVISQRKGRRSRTRLKSCAERALRLGAALMAQGLRPGDVVATFCNAETEHFEAYLGVPARGMVLHPLNLRMHDSDLADCLRVTGDRVLILSREHLARFASLAPHLAETALELIVITGEGPLPACAVPVARYETLLSTAPAELPGDLPDVAETAAAAICHTGGTTGKPKAVVYSHRSIWLQALSLTAANSVGLSRRDTLLAAVPLFHVNGWGLPFAAVMAGANLILPGAVFRPDVLNAFMDDCDVTVAAGVPTIWTDLMELRKTAGAPRFRTLARLATGGAVVPRALSNAMAEQGVEIIQAWGMTETSSMSVLGRIEPDATPGLGAPVPVGYPMPGIEMRVVDPDGAPLPHDGAAAGELQVRGACVARCYLGAEAPASFDGGWFRTGDIGRIDAQGRILLTDRLKDAIKSGGEWIAAPVLEDALRSLPGISDAAVIAMEDARFQERPLAVLVCADGRLPDIDDLRLRLKSLVPSWWVPDAWSLSATLPRTGLGKPDKAALRAQYAAGALALVRTGAPQHPTNDTPHSEKMK